MHWTEILAFAFLGAAILFSIGVFVYKKKKPSCSCTGKGEDLVKAYHKKYKKCDCAKKDDLR